MPATPLLAIDSGPWPARVLRWAGRLGSLASLSLLVLFATSGGSAPSAYEWLLLAFFPIGVAVGTVVAWRSEILGGVIATASLGVFHALISMDSARPPAGPWFLVFASPAVALLACGVISRASQRRPAP